MIHLDDVKYLAGNSLEVVSYAPFHDNAVEFLQALSKKLLQYRDFPDIVTFGFYIRKSNILKLKEKYINEVTRIGKGLIFHISPSNVPINFAYSFLFGLLSGNSNIIKVSSKEYEQVNIICNEINILFQEEQFSLIKKTNVFIRYTNIDEVTEYISSISDGRIIWGGDETIKHIRKFPLKVRGIDISFADRYSVCILGSDEVCSADESQLKRLADNFYNDAFLFDQNACSSPQVVFWYGNNVEKAKNIFWNSVRKAASRYDLAPVKIVDKYTNMLHNIVDYDNFKAVLYGNEIYCLEIDKYYDNLLGRFGLFYEITLDSMEKIVSTIRDKCQTITYFGVDKTLILNTILNNNVFGVDRIVPVGMALDIGIIWDGYDIVNSLTRIIDVV